jgi:hypothetical protein
MQACEIDDEETNQGKGFLFKQPIFVVFTIILYSLHVSVVRPSSGGIYIFIYLFLYIHMYV